MSKVTTRHIDTHCHPQMAAFDGDRTEMVQRTLGAGVGMIVIGTTIEDSLAGIRLVEQYPQEPLWAAVGIHPTDSDIADVPVADLGALIAHPRVVAVGETGLDFFRLADGDDTQLQIDLFEQHILLALQYDRALIVHCRDHAGSFDAYDQVLALLRRHQVKRFVMHCYSGDWAHAESFLELGGLLSFTGIITFPKSDLMQDIVRRAPLERLMIETDAPFLAPVPHRGKRCEPLDVQYVAGKMAELRKLPADQIARATTTNAQRFFRLSQLAKQGSG